MAKNVDLKPFRAYNGNDVVNLFAHVSGDADKGSVVALDVADYDDYHEFQFGTSDFDSNFSSFDLATKWKVKDAKSTDVAYGLLLNDVRTVDSNGNKLTQGVGLHELKARDLVPSGKTVPVLRRGIVTITGFSGNPSAGSAAVVDPNADGKILVAAATTTSGRIGTFLTDRGTDGYAVLEIGR